MSWRIGLATGVCIDRSVLDVLPAIRRAGASGIEINTPPRHFDLGQPRQIDELARAVDRECLQVVSMHAPFGGALDLADPNPRHRSAAVDACRAAATALKQLGGHVLVAHPTDLARDGHDVASRLADAARSLTRLHADCADLGITLDVESPLPHVIGGDPKAFGELLTALPASVGVCLDTGHTALGRHWRQFIETVGTRLTHVHAHDNRGTWDDHLPPGLGAIDWADIARSLREVQFDGWIMLELACPDSQSLDTYLRDARDRTSALLDA
jgi:sugar phosphate isomerase/epimerase